MSAPPQRPARPMSICMGRAAVDLYGEQIGGRLEDMRLVRQIPRRLAGQHRRRRRRASGLKPRDADARRRRAQRAASCASARPPRASTCSHVTHRSGAADRAGASSASATATPSRWSSTATTAPTWRSTADDVDRGLDRLGAARCCSPARTCRSRSTLRRAPARRSRWRASHTRIVLDIDYRPGALGPDRARASASSATSPSTRSRAQLQAIVADVRPGRRHRGGDPASPAARADTLAAPRAPAQLTDGDAGRQARPMGCVVFDAAIPGRHRGSGLAGPGFPVEVFNVLGAGDAFMAGFLRGWLDERAARDCCRLRQCLRRAASSRATAARRRCRAGPSCSTSSPTARPSAASALRRRARAPAPRDHAPDATGRELAVLAFDHRVQLEELAAQPAPIARRTRIAALQVPARQRRAPRCRARRERAAPALRRDRRRPLSARTCCRRSPAAAAGSRGRSSCRVAAAGVRGRRRPRAGAARSWPTEHVAKCLVSYHPRRSAGAARGRSWSGWQALQARLRRHRPRVAGRGDPAARGMPQATPTPARARSSRSMPPASAPTGGSCRRRTGALEWVADRCGRSRGDDPHCRGVLLLGLEASEAALARSFATAAPHARCRGFAVGRSIFGDAADGLVRRRR